MQPSMLWVLAVTYTVHSLVLQVHPYFSCDMPGNFPNFVLQPPSAGSWQQLAFIVVTYHFTQSAQGHNGTLVSTRRQVLNTMHEIVVDSTQMDSCGRGKRFPASPVQVQAQQYHLSDSSSIKIPKSQPVHCSLGEEKPLPSLKRHLMLADGGISNSVSD